MYAQCYTGPVCNTIHLKILKLVNCLNIYKHLQWQTMQIICLLLFTQRYEGFPYRQNISTAHIDVTARDHRMTVSPPRGTTWVTHAKRGRDLDVNFSVIYSHKMSVWQKALTRSSTEIGRNTTHKNTESLTSTSS